MSLVEWQHPAPGVEAPVDGIGKQFAVSLARAADCRARVPKAYQAAIASKRWTWIP